MEEKKYYTPTIEEFHEGIECEYLKNDRPSDGYKSIVFHLDQWGDFLDISHYTFRIPYLCKEDIEELGWKYDQNKMKGSSLEVFYNSELELTFDPKECQVWIKDKDEPVFIGVIKNKSRLRLVMEMVGII
jgi:hypothetical protein